MDVVSVVNSQHMNAKCGSSDLRNIPNRRAAASFTASLKCPRSRELAVALMGVCTPGWGLLAVALMGG